MRRGASPCDRQSCPPTTVKDELPAAANVEMRSSMVTTFGHSAWTFQPRSVVSWRREGSGSVELAKTLEHRKNDARQPKLFSSSSREYAQKPIPLRSIISENDRVARRHDKGYNQFSRPSTSAENQRQRQGTTQGKSWGRMNDLPSTGNTEARLNNSQNDSLLPLQRFHGVSARNVYMIEFSVANRRLGRVLIETNPHLAPVATASFVTMCIGKPREEPRISYEGSRVLSIKRGKYISSGDNTMNDGTGGMSIVYHHPFFRESYKLKVERGSVAMVYEVAHLLFCSQPVLTSRFKIFLSDEPDDNVAVFGRVISGLDVVERISTLDNDKGKPRSPVFISSCGKLNYV